MNSTATASWHSIPWHEEFTKGMNSILTDKECMTAFRDAGQKWTGEKEFGEVLEFAWPYSGDTNKLLPHFWMLGTKAGRRLISEQVNNKARPLTGFEFKELDPTNDGWIKLRMSFKMTNEPAQ